MWLTKKFIIYFQKYLCIHDIKIFLDFLEFFLFLYYIFLVILNINFKLKINDLPNGIKTLIICNEEYNEELNNLPDSLEHLELPYCYEKEIKKIPKNLKTIKLNQYYKFRNIFFNVKI